MHHRMSKLTRRVILTLNVLLILAYFFPIWKIHLFAPQYPEGLNLDIKVRSIGGQLDIINDLNHYIGMKSIQPNDILELKLMPYILGVIIVLGGLVWKFGSNSWLTVWTWLLVIAGSAGLMDFYKWEYDYGHHLDPHAAIIVPGMTYQPPFLGTKQLLNFTATSYPGIGGIILFATALFAAINWFFIFVPLLKRRHHLKVVHKKLAMASFLIVTCCLSSCSTSPEPLVYAKDVCAYCNMQLEDPHFGAEIISGKGKIYKFDCDECMIHFLNSMNGNDLLNGEVFSINYYIAGQFLDAKKSFFLKSPKIHSPMGMNLASFSGSSDVKKAQAELGGEILLWEDAVNYIKSATPQQSGS
ncbi:MAG: hypothetical protein HKL88_04445 [Bacteroidia bacterium]|jgi:copper chaperone NosL|nr:hypothetical protein [Bacteroidia bacterium]